jgi:hypothetical protein
LCQARTPAAVQQACGRWAAFSPKDVSPARLLAYTSSFVAMKRDQRFPHSLSADDARVSYLSAGLAGASIGVSPLTAIHRLRTMKHEPDGPLVWKEFPQPRCHCWRCDRDREMKAFDEIVAAAQEQSEG